MCIAKELEETEQTCRDNGYQMRIYLYNKCSIENQHSLCNSYIMRWFVTLPLMGCDETCEEDLDGMPKLGRGYSDNNGSDNDKISWRSCD